MNIWNFIINKLSRNKSVILIIVIESKGSSPGRIGFKMVISEDFELFGSIGGGVMEFEMVEYAKTLFQKECSKAIFKKQVHNKKSDQDQSGMICSGHQTLVLYHIKPTIDYKETINKLVHCIDNNCKSFAAFTPFGIKLIEQNILNAQYKSSIRSEDDWEYLEQISYRNELYIVGGGHVGKALTQTMVQLGFYVYVLDNRKDLNTMESNLLAHQKMHINYDEIENHIPQGDHVYIVIMTNRHLEDKKVLEKLIRLKTKYLGLMGSKSKVQKLFSQLTKEGVLQEQFEKVYSPIGIDIKSETPQEIAISIAAEIIMIKNKKKR